MTSAAAGFILAMVGPVSDNVAGVANAFSDLQDDGVGVERAASYLNLPQECGSDLPLQIARSQNGEAPLDLDRSWLREGRLTATNVCVRYAPSFPDILHNVSFDIEGGSRVGVVGATGSGKSTLAKTLFGFTEISGGSIKIDGTSESRLVTNRSTRELQLIK